MMNASVKMSPNRHQAGAEQRVQRLYIIGDARHEPANRIPIVEAQVRVLEFLKNFPTQVVHDRLAEPGGHERPRVLQDESRDEGGSVQGNEVDQQVAISGRDGLVDDPLSDPRPYDGHPRAEQQNDERSGDLPGVGAQVTDQPTHESCVVGFAKSLFVVEQGSVSHGQGYTIVHGRGPSGYCASRQVHGTLAESSRSPTERDVAGGGVDPVAVRFII